MSKTLEDLALDLYENDKKVTLIYAFNGSGKTRLSRVFKELIAPKNTDDESGDETELSRSKILYYNAFTEDLFYWDNDLENDAEPKLKIQPNSFTEWILRDQGQDRNIITNFQRYANQKLTPRFSEDFTEVTFSLERGDDERSGFLKIAKGEESNFIWSVFQTLMDQVISILNVIETDQRETNQFDQLEYVFIDDPVSSLDENHLIELAVTLAELIKSSQSDLKFIITTHSPLLYNVLHNELNSKACYLLERFEDGSFDLTPKQGDSNKSFSYHLHLKQTLEKAISDNSVQKYHFTLLRNLYEKTANFLGYGKWSDLLDTAPGDKQGYLNRIIQFSSHRTLSSEEVAQPTDPEKQMVRLLLDNLLNNYGFLQQEEQHG
ncbi:anticodon nuclease [Saccharophagus degradans]|uniref:anticodon nuclease n=1 Tax=Saccharophagus degradans TaxID=86304 RepID=UPI001C080E97|nr:anticodon nuclease [Saccharophagus degradans]MBU2984753.1 anticodon nuclease [Saccharophagus degradans]